MRASEDMCSVSLVFRITLQGNSNPCSYGAVRLYLLDNLIDHITGQGFYLRAHGGSPFHDLGMEITYGENGVFTLNVKALIAWIEQGGSPLDDGVTEAPPQVIDAVIDLFLFCVSVFEKTHLLGNIPWF